MRWHPAFLKAQELFDFLVKLKSSGVDLNTIQVYAESSQTDEQIELHSGLNLEDCVDDSGDIRLTWDDEEADEEGW